MAGKSNRYTNLKRASSIVSRGPHRQRFGELNTSAAPALASARLCALKDVVTQSERAGYFGQLIATATATARIVATVL
jgi:hypothetical protein